MRLVIVSDTHQRHRRLKVPDGDVLIHAGDFTNWGEEKEIVGFDEWLATQPHKHKIVVPGNHDIMFQTDLPRAWSLLRSATSVLVESGVTINGVKFWGSPWTPEFHSWAFNYPPQDAVERWAPIPAGTDVLITHGPPMGVMDYVPPTPKRPIGTYIGCPELLRRVEAVKPRFHIFGHIHETGGKLVTKDTTFINAAMAGANREMDRDPFVVDIDTTKG